MAMLKTIQTSALITSLPPDACLIEANCNVPSFFTGVRTMIVNGMAYLIFYAEQPDTSGRIEYIVVGRLVAPEMRAAACLTHAAMEIAKGPVAIERPAN
jgi:hypothetical protein